MTQEFDLARALAAGLEDRAAAWHFICGYAREWLVPLADGDGWPASDLDAAEARLGVKLPAALREAYGLLGGRDDLTSNFNVLLAPQDLYLDDLGQALVFQDENQGCAAWGVLIADLGQLDPPVVIKLDLADKQAERWEQWLNCLSTTFMEIVLSESVLAPMENCDFLSGLDDQGRAELEQHYVRLPFPDYPTAEPSVRWYSGPGAILREDVGGVLHVRARTPETLEGVREQIDGDWLSDYE
ncbi:SMI1/KNR4 family protein [Kitasatospora sp. MAP5-34]|uniref:SMI1/KNR4 family protein n=1 Tax=Kitasatospora sp. MAP5-34 TaxID=3035102 RepID=UPI0024733D8F|nr:SMI1/KNR4 family protein [Kitasatospora sp. MAP5-34]MDH6579119.1 hypothetical protein [Kitasatospora sp. MAP5-34]